MGEVLPSSYLSLEGYIISKVKEGKAVVTREEMIAFAKHVHLQDSQLDNALQFLHNTGVVFHSTIHDKLKDFIVLNPQWLSKALACIVTVQGHGSSDIGVFSKADLLEIWREYLLCILFFIF